MIDIKKIIIEELSDKQKTRVDSWSKKTTHKPTISTILGQPSRSFNYFNKENVEHGLKSKGFENLIPLYHKDVTPNKSGYNFSNHVFGNEDRVVLPFETPSKKTSTPKDINNFIEQTGHKIKDYKAGLATDKYGRDVKLGRIFEKHKNHPDAPKLLEKFNKDPNRQNKSDDLQVVISRHPYDVAGMSTNRGWTSCMDMEKNKAGYKNALKADVNMGTHVAYLTKKGDNTIENPIARISLKPYIAKNDPSDTIIRSTETTYGSAGSKQTKFNEIVNNWTHENFPGKNMFYKKHPKERYNEGAGNLININKHTPAKKIMDIDENHFKNDRSLFHQIKNHPQSKSIFKHYLDKCLKNDNSHFLYNLIPHISTYGLNSKESIAKTYKDGRGYVLSHPDIIENKNLANIVANRYLTKDLKMESYDNSSSYEDKIVRRLLRHFPEHHTAFKNLGNTAFKYLIATKDY